MSYLTNGYFSNLQSLNARFISTFIPFIIIQYSKLIIIPLLPASSNFQAKKQYDKDPKKKVDVELLSYKLDVFSLGLITLYALDKDNFLSKKKHQLNIDEILLKSYLSQVKNSKIIQEVDFFCLLEEMLAFKPESRLSLEKLHHWIVK